MGQIETIKDLSGFYFYIRLIKTAYQYSFTPCSRKNELCEIIQTQEIAPGFRQRKRAATTRLTRGLYKELLVIRELYRHHRAVARKTRRARLKRDMFSKPCLNDTRRSSPISCLCT